MKRLIAFLTVLLFPMIAWAEEAASALSQIADYGVQVLAMALGLFFIWLARKGVNLFEKKFNMDIPDRIEAQLDALVEKAIAYGEEQARKVVKDKLSDKMLPNDKMEAALQFGLKLADQYGLPKMGEDKLKMLIESKLNISRYEEE